MNEFRIVRNVYYDIYYNEDDKKQVARAARIRAKLIKRGFELSDADAHSESIVCDQMLKTKFMKNI
jgi:hypothetical protein